MIRRALQNTGWLMGARGINAVLSLVYLVLATRALGLDGFGQFVIAFTFAQLVVGFTSFQTWQAIIRWGQEDDGRKTASGFALALDASTIIVGTLAAALILGLAGDWLPIAQELRLPTFLFTVVSLLAIRSTPAGLLRLHDQYARAAAADAVEPLGAVVERRLGSFGRLGRQVEHVFKTERLGVAADRVAQDVRRLEARQAGDLGRHRVFSC